MNKLYVLLLIGIISVVLLVSCANADNDSNNNVVPLDNSNHIVAMENESNEKSSSSDNSNDIEVVSLKIIENEEETDEAMISEFRNFTGFEDNGLFVFRGFKLFDSKENVIRNESFEKDTTSHLFLKNDLAYSTLINNENATLYYIFNDDNKLIEGLYIIENNHVNLGLHLDSYNYVKQKLVEDYGETVEDDFYWLKDRFKKDESKYGYALSIGELRLECSWLVNDYRIELTHWGDSYEESTSGGPYSSDKQSDDLTETEIDYTKVRTIIHYYLKTDKETSTTDF